MAQFPDATVVAVMEREETGANMLPLALATKIATTGNLELNQTIYSSGSISRKNKNAVQRLLSIKNFIGRVQKGRNYIIVDDVLTQGGTVAELRHYIDNNGGKVVAVSSLAHSAGSNVVAIQPATLKELRRRFGRGKLEKILNEHNIVGKLEALTESQARTILRFGSFDSFRTRLLEEAVSARRETVDEGQGTPDSLLDRLSQGAKGATEFLADGRRIIHLFESADITTLLHELAHIARRYLDPASMSVIKLG